MCCELFRLFRGYFYKSHDDSNIYIIFDGINNTATMSYDDIQINTENLSEEPVERTEIEYQEISYNEIAHHEILYANNSLTKNPYISHNERILNNVTIINDIKHEYVPNISN